MEFEPKDKKQLINEGYELYKKEGANSLIDEYNGYMESLGDGIDIAHGNILDEDIAKEYGYEPMYAMEEVLGLIEDENQEQADYIAGYVEKTNDENDVERAIECYYEDDYYQGEY